VTSNNEQFTKFIVLAAGAVLLLGTALSFVGNSTKAPASSAPKAEEPLFNYVRSAPMEIGSTQTVWKAMWACPVNAPGQPIRGNVDRFATERAEGRCFNLNVRDHVRVDIDTRSTDGTGDSACVAPVGSIKPCQWIPRFILFEDEV